MSFTTTSQLNNLLLRGLQVRTNSNTPISTFFALYADGRGGTFWDQALRASDLSSYSTSVALIGEDQSTLTSYTTSSITGMENQIVVLEDNFSTLAGSVSTQIEQAFYGFSTNVYFADQVSSLQLELQTSASSIYSTLSSYDNANFSTLSSYINGSQTVSFGYTDSSISTVYTQSVSTSQASLDAFSTLINNSLLSSSVAFASTILTQNSSLAYYISTDTAQTISTNSSFLTSISSLAVQISNLQYVSSMTDSTLSTYISSYVNKSLNSYDISTQSSITSILGNLCTISTVAISTAILAISTATGFAGQLNNLSIQTQQNTSSITNLNFSLNLLTTSTLISSIYESFLGLETFCCTLVQSTNSALTNTLNSTTQSFISTIYSTIVVDVIVLVQDILTSTIQSTTDVIYSTFNSTISTIYDAFVVDLTAQLDSSIFAYVSTPVASSLEVFSTMTYEVISTFSTNYEGALSTFSTMAGQEISTFSTNYETALANFSTLTSVEVSTFSTLYNSTLIQAGTTFTNFVIGLQNFVSSSALSTLYTEQIFTLSGGQSTASLDLPAFRNFAIFISDILDTSEYRITYNPTALYGMDWKTGTILINVLSTGSYSYNNGKIVMDTYRWGFPTSIYDSMFPTLSSADYTLMYDYRIYNSTLYTSLQNIYPRLRILNANVIGGGGSVTADWTNYSWIPTGLLGSPPFSPQINVDLLQGGFVVQRVGPFDITVSTTTFATTLTGSTDVSIYFAGSVGEGEIVNVNL